MNTLNESSATGSNSDIDVDWLDDSWRLNLFNESSSDYIDYDKLASWNLNPENRFGDAIQQWHKAVQDCNGPKFREGLDAKLPVNAVIIHEETGYTLLTRAAREGVAIFVNYLLFIGVDRTYINGSTMQYNALHAASIGGDPEIVGMLLNDDDDKKKTNKKKLTIDMPTAIYGQSPLQIAIIFYQFTLAEDLITKYGANPHFTDKRGQTPLATLLGCFIRKNFDTFTATHAQQVEKLAALLLASGENVFTKYNAIAEPAILTLNTCERAINQPSPTLLEHRVAYQKLVNDIKEHCPRFAAALREQAGRNPSGLLENEFITLYGDGEYKAVHKKITNS